MKESIKSKIVVTPLPVLIIDTEILNEHGKVDYDKLRPISFDSETNTYRELGGIAGRAFHDGTAISNG